MKEQTVLPMWSNSSSEPDSPVATPRSATNKRFKEKHAHAERSRVVMLEGYMESPDTADQRSYSNGEPVAARTKSLTDDDLEELKGCVDLGFGFSYEEIPELCSTLPALELCYSMTQKFLEESSSSKPDEPATDSMSPLSSSPIPVANWKISSPGDDPDEVKARLKYWAQAVACTVRLCS